MNVKTSVAEYLALAFLVATTLLVGCSSEKSLEVATTVPNAANEIGPMRLPPTSPYLVAGRAVEDGAEASGPSFGVFTADALVIKTALVGDLSNETPLSELNEKPVVRVGDGAFRNCGAKTVYFDDGVKKIGRAAFEDSDLIERVWFPPSLEEIDEDAFARCDALRRVDIPESVTRIAPGAFASCRGLEEFTVDEKNPTYCAIRGVLFTKDQRRIVAYPAGRREDSYGVYKERCREIGERAFEGAKSLKVVIVWDVDTIGANAFRGCDSLLKIEMSPRDGEIGENAIPENVVVLRPTW